MTQQSLITRLKAVEKALAVALPASKWSADVEFHNAALSDLRELIKEAEGQKSAAFKWGDDVVAKTQLKHCEELYTALGVKEKKE